MLILIRNLFRITEEGRRLFPSIGVFINNLHPSSIYQISLQFIEQDRYRFMGDKWIKINHSDPNRIVQQSEEYIHPDSPNSGQFWMSNSLSFSRVKITNRTEDIPFNQVTKNNYNNVNNLFFFLR